MSLFQPDSRDLKPNGCYNILLCESGFWKNYTVDDLFPCSVDSGSPCFATGHGKELWVQLLEKVYAKACGSYKATEAGYPFEALINLTGAPYASIRLQGEDDWKLKKSISDGSLFRQLKLNDDKGYLQTASTSGEVSHHSSLVIPHFSFLIPLSLLLIHFVTHHSLITH